MEKVERKRWKNSVKPAGNRSASLQPTGKPAYCSDGWKRERATESVKGSEVASRCRVTHVSPFVCVRVPVVSKDRPLNANTSAVSHTPPF